MIDLRGICYRNCRHLHWRQFRPKLYSSGAPTRCEGNPAAFPAGGGADLRITVFARDIPHRDYAVTSAGIIPLVFLGHFLYALAPCVMEFAGVGIDDVIA